MKEKFPNQMKVMPIKLQEAYRSSNTQNKKRNFSWHIKIKTLSIQDKERILKAARKKHQVIYKGRPIRIVPNFSKETLKVRKAWTHVLQALRDHRWQPRVQYLSTLSITIGGGRKTLKIKPNLSSIYQQEGTRRRI